VTLDQHAEDEPDSLVDVLDAPPESFSNDSNRYSFYENEFASTPLPTRGVINLYDSPVDHGTSEQVNNSSPACHFPQPWQKPPRQKSTIGPAKTNRDRFGLGQTDKPKKKGACIVKRFVRRNRTIEASKNDQPRTSTAVGWKPKAKIDSNQTTLFDHFESC
jgi:hypothetical protein